MPLTEGQGLLQSVTFGLGTNYQIDEPGPVGIGVPSPKTNDVDLRHDDGSYAGADHKASRIITIPFIVIGTSPSNTMDNFETLAAAWEPVAADVELELYLPGKHFTVDGRPRGLAEDLSLLHQWVVHCIGTFVGLDPALTAA